MRSSRLLDAVVALLGVFVLLAAGCSRPAEPELPPGDDLLQAAAQEMQRVSSVRFDLQVTGPLGTPAIQRANGVLTQAGDASGAVTLDMGGTKVEYDVVIAGGQVYLKGPTGRFQELPRGAVYNPADLLSPSAGLAKVLDATSGARTEAVEAVGDAQAHRVSATIDARALEGLLPVQLEEDAVPASLWVGQDRPRLLRVRLTATTRGAEEPTTMTVLLSDFDAPVEIAPPAS